MNNIQNQQLACSFWSKHNGTGRTVMGNLRSVITTIIQIVKGIFTREKDAVKRPGKQFSGTTLTKFIGKKIPGVTLVQQFYLADISTIHNKNTLEEMEKKILDIEQQGEPIAIPIVLKKKFHRNHVVLALVMNNQVEYYNSVGETSDKFHLADGKTLKDFLEVLKDELTDNGEIIENKTTHQFDSYNCGAYVANYIYERVNQEKSPKGISATPYSHREIVAFRNQD